MQDATEAKSVAAPGLLGGSLGQRVIEREDDVPSVVVPRLPDATGLWLKGMIVAWLWLLYFFWDQVSLLLMNYWLLDALGFEDVFWTNFRMGAGLFAVAFLVFTLAIALPAVVHKLSDRLQWLILQMAFFIGLLAAVVFARNYLDFLLLFNGKSFGTDDPVFGHDIGFYAFRLPAIWHILNALTLAALFGLVSSVFTAYLANREKPRGDMNRLVGLMAVVATPVTMVMLGLLGLALAADIWLQRYGLLFKDNSEVAVNQGAQYLDVTGFFSTLNAYYFTAFVALAVTGALLYVLWHLRRSFLSEGAFDWRNGMRIGFAAIAVLIMADFGFAVSVGIRDRLAVRPNHPVIQFDYIQRHIDATLAGYGLEDVEIVPFQPNTGDLPAPDPDALLNTGTFQNISLWPGYIAQLERLLDPEYVDRVTATDGDPFILNTTLEAFQQEQKLRAYYNIMDIDTLRYTRDGEPVILATGVRELPALEVIPKLTAFGQQKEEVPWLTAWGQEFVLFTHGYGFVAAPVGTATAEGDPEYVAHSIPYQSEWPELALDDNASVYYGEGAATIAFSNIKDLNEFDYATDQGRAELLLQPGEATSIEMDSWLKRLVIAFRSELFYEIFFSTLIRGDSHVHYDRTPIERVEEVAPFLFYDSDPFAVPVDGRLVWLINGMSTTDMYPYSIRSDLGDKSYVRTPVAQPPRWVNYVRDSVKVAVDAATGEVTLYKFADEPVVDTWEAIYPDLFTPVEEMPEELRAQIQYPLQLFHTQFDDIYVFYHQTKALEFFNQEDSWDDADEVLGPIIDAGRAITFSIEPYYWLPETGGVLPESGVREQFALSKVFTPEGAINLRAIVTVYQDGDDYGRLSVLQIPKGFFYQGPEQAEAAIDQEPDISEQFSWWNRTGTEVIRGAITTVVTPDGEIIYVEPIFIRSEQLRLPQLKRIVVVYRGVARMGETLDEALRLAISGERTSLPRTTLIDGVPADPADTGVPPSGVPDPGLE